MIDDKQQAIARWGHEGAEFLRRNVLGLVAIFIALSGTAYANMKVGAADIDRSAVRAAHIAKKHVRAKHLARNAVRSPHLAKRAVRPRHLLPGSIKSWAIADGAITADKLSADLAGALEPDPTVVDGRPMAGDLTGAFPNPVIAEGAVTSDKLADGAVGSSNLIDNAVTSDKIEPLAVGTGQIDDGAIAPVKIQNAAVQTRKIADDAVTSAKLGPQSVRGRHFFSSGTRVLNPGTIAPGACTGLNIFATPSGPAVAMASLSPQAASGLVASTGYHLNTFQLGVRICNMTAATLPIPDYFNYVFIEL